MTIKVELKMPAQSWWRNFVIDLSHTKRVTNIEKLNEALAPYSAKYIHNDWHIDTWGCGIPMDTLEFKDEQSFIMFALRWS